MNNIILFLFNILLIHGINNNPGQKIKLVNISSFGNQKGAWILNTQGITFLQNDFLLVSDKLANNIKEFNKKGILVQQFGKRGSKEGEFNGPGPINSNGNYVVVADFASPRIQIFSNEFKFISKFYTPGPIFDVKIDNSNAVWVGVYTSNKEKEFYKFDIYGKIISTIELKNTNGGMFDDIFNFCFDSQNLILIAYYVQNKIEVWNRFNNYVNQFSVINLPFKPRDTVLSLGINGNKIKAPDGNIFESITTDKFGNIFLLSGDYSKNPHKDVYVYNKEYKFITMFTLPSYAYKILIDRNNYLYAIEECRTIIKKYEIKYFRIGQSHENFSQKIF